MFWVPVAELPANLREKKPLFASDLNFTTPPAPTVGRTPAGDKALADAMTAMRGLAEKIGKSPRAQKDLSGRTNAVGVKTGGGDFGLHVAASRLKVEPGLPGKSDFVMVTNDPAVFTRWVADGSLTDAAVEGKLWLPHKEAFGLLPILDRLPRSVRRDVK
jgi:hypothetical protein